MNLEYIHMYIYPQATTPCRVKRHNTTRHGTTTPVTRQHHRYDLAQLMATSRHDHLDTCSHH